MIIEVRKIIDKSIAVSTDDAKKVKKEIVKAINIDNNTIAQKTGLSVSEIENL